MPSGLPAIEKYDGADETDEASFPIPSRGQVRTWGARSAVSLLDQAFTSAAGFAANVLLARWMSPTVYGAFAVAFAGYLFLTLFHNALLLEPLSVIGPARHAAQLRQYFRAQLRVHGVLVWPLTATTLVAAWILSRFAPQSPLIGALVGGGLSLPLLLLLWLTRRMCYVLQRPSIALFGSGVYFVFSLATILALHAFSDLTPLTAFFALGIASLAGSWLIFQQINTASDSDPAARGIFWNAALHENWMYGRWLIGSAVLYAVSNSTQTFFVAGALGLGAAGILRAMQVPSLVMTQTVTAIALLILPAFAYDFGNRQHKRLSRNAVLVGFALGITALGFTVCLALSGAHIESLLYNGKYAPYARLIPILALIPVANGFGTGWSMALRASQKPHCDLVANAFGAPVAVLSTLLLVPRWGLMGAAVSMVLSFIVTNFVVLIFFLGPDRNKGSEEMVMEAKTEEFAHAVFEEDV